MKTMQFLSTSVAVGLVSTTLAAPAGEAAKIKEALAALQGRAPQEYINCSPEQQTTLQAVLGDLLRYTSRPLEEFLTNNFDANKLAYSHYFTPENHDMVTAAFRAAVDAANPATSLAVTYKIRCVEQHAGCLSGAFAFTQPFPEEFFGGGFPVGVREVTICPAFWTESRTTRRLPETEEEIAEYCQFVESKRYNEFETGAHTLLHEISHLDKFGRAAGYPARHQDAGFNFPEYDYQGTDDWHDNSTPGNARVLKTSTATDRIDPPLNAESLAAFALEWWVATVCGLEDVPL